MVATNALDAGRRIPGRRESEGGPELPKALARPGAATAVQAVGQQARHAARLQDEAALNRAEGLR
jgi:hypothetical protein